MLREPDLTPLPKTLDWSCISLKRGETMLGVLCGRVRKFQCHTLKNGQSKPCLRYTTGGKLACWCESTNVSIRPIVYVPVVTREGEQFVIRMSAVQGWKVESIPAGSLVEFSRPDRAKRPTVAKRIMGPTACQEWVLKLKGKCDRDITEYLCHLWQLHALTKYCGFTAYRSIAAACTVDLSEPDYKPRFEVEHNPILPFLPAGEGV